MYSRRRFSIALIALIALTMMAATPLLASGSKSKTPAANASTDADKATTAYNDGVKKMEHADALGVKKSATYTYDYAAVPDGKAIREYEQAVAEFARAVSLNPKMKEAHNNLGYCYRRIGKLTESLTSYDRAIELDPDFAQAREYRGETYLALGQPEKAEAELAVLQGLQSKYAEHLAQAIAMYRDREAQQAGAAGGQ